MACNVYGGMSITIGQPEKVRNCYGEIVDSEEISIVAEAICSRIWREKVNLADEYNGCCVNSTFGVIVPCELPGICDGMRAYIPVGEYPNIQCLPMCYFVYGVTPRYSHTGAIHHTSFYLLETACPTS
jgi:hypothetical protein